MCSAAISNCQIFLHSADYVWLLPLLRYVGPKRPRGLQVMLEDFAYRTDGAGTAREIVLDTAERIQMWGGKLIIMQRSTTPRCSWMSAHCEIRTILS